ncbi:MAG: hypothetical protein ACE5G0_05595 [Rhodothermales bacterium]
MKTLLLNDTEQAVFDVIQQHGVADQHDILRVLDPELGMYYIAEVLETLYAMGLIREVDIGCFSLYPVPKAA